jgi:hypothetical protein
MTWRITLVDGNVEVTPPEVDKVKTNSIETLLFAYSTRNYGPDELIATYSLVNVVKWEKIK